MARYRVFVATGAGLQFPEGIKVEEEYPGYAIVSGSENAIGALRSKYPVEPLKETAPPQQAAQRRAAKTVRAAKRKLPVGDVVVQFNAPIKKEWLKEIERAGAKVKRPLGESSVIVSLPTAKVAGDVKKNANVTGMDPHVAVIQLSPEFVGQLEGNATGRKIAQAAVRRASGATAASKKKYASMPATVIASFLTEGDAKDARRVLSKKGYKQIQSGGETSLVVNLQKSGQSKGSLKDLTALDGLMRVEEKHVPRLQNDVARLAIGKGVVTNNPGGLGLSGAGEVVAVADTGLDTGDPNTIHLDFRGRIQDITSFPIAPSWATYVTNPGADDGPDDRYSGHGTHTSGSVLGDGARAQALGLNPIQGMAPAAKLVFQAIEQTPVWTQQMQLDFLQHNQQPPTSGLYGIPDNLEDLFSAAYAKGARIHSNSWGGGNPGDYGAQSESVDRFMWNNRDFLVVIAAGNDGKEIPGGSTIALGSVTPPGTSKNCLTVGASENPRGAQFTNTYGQWWPDDFPNPPLQTDSMTDSVDDLVAFSSRGPCATQRRKPDVVAPGTFVLSTRSSRIPSNNFGWSSYPPAKNDYMYDGGTSMATPLTAGSTALVREYLRSSVGISKPSAALLKAAIIHSAQYVKYRYANAASGPWADDEQGWGRIELSSLLAPSAPSKILFFDEDVQLQQGQQQDFQIAVNDPSVPLRITMVYTDFPGPNLINNLNLFAYDPQGQYTLGNDFQTTGTPDAVNNVEGIVVPNPKLGTWTVRVVATGLGNAPQSFALVISGGNIATLAQPPHAASPQVRRKASSHKRAAKTGKPKAAKRKRR